MQKFHYPLLGVSLESPSVKAEVKPCSVPEIDPWVVGDREQSKV